MRHYFHSRFTPSQVLGDRAAYEVINIVFAYYYIGIIEKNLASIQFSYTGVTPFIAEQRRVRHTLPPLAPRMSPTSLTSPAQLLLLSLNDTLRNKPDMILNIIKKGIAYRSQTVASICFFIIIQVFP